MSSTLSPRLVATLGALTLAPSAHARPAGRTCYDIEYIELAESLDSNVTGVNDHLQVVGQYCIHEDCDPWEVGGYVYDLRTGRTETFAVDGREVVGWGKINNAGQVVFEAFDDEGRSAGFLRAADGTITPLPFPGEGEPTSYSACGINSAGTVVGYAWDAATGYNRGVVWRDGGYTLTDGPGPGDNYLVDIADDGTVVGVAAWEDGAYGFMDDGTAVTWFGLDEGWWNQALGVNNRGQVVLFDMADDLGAAWVSTRGSLVPLLPDEDAYVLGADINNHGVVALEISTDHSRGAIARPVPCRAE